MVDFNASDIWSLNLALKVKQYLRSSDENNKHVIRILQSEVLELNPERFINRSTCNKFLSQVRLGLGKIFDIMVKEISNCDDDNRLHKTYFDLIASEEIIPLLKHLKAPPIAILYCNNITRTLGLSKHDNQES